LGFQLDVGCHKNGCHENGGESTSRLSAFSAEAEVRHKQKLRDIVDVSFHRLVHSLDSYTDKEQAKGKMNVMAEMVI